MATSLALQLVPGLSPSPTLQRYVRSGETVGALTGAAITGIVDVTNTHVWNFDVSTWASADYYVLLSGVSSPNALPFPMRITTATAYYADFWWELEQLTAITAALGSVTTTGTITTPIVIGDDYLSSTGRAFQWTIAALTGYVAATATCKFGGKYKTNTWLVSGTVTDLGTGNWTLSFDLPKASTMGLAEGYYEWSVEVSTAAGLEYTRVRSGKNVLLVDKQT